MALRTEVIAAFPCAPSPIFEQCGLFRRCILSNNLYNKQGSCLRRFPQAERDAANAATDLNLS